VEELAIIR